MSELQLLSGLYAFFAFLLGLCMGSFANVVIYRLPVNKSVISPRSHCPHCQKTLSWYELIPVVSWIIQRGKCRNCSHRISARYALVEFIMGVLFLGIFWEFGVSFATLEYWVFAFGLVTVSFIDLDHMILPDEFTLAGIVLGLLGALLSLERTFFESLAGVLLGGGFLWTIAVLYQKLRNQEGMGGGDIKLLAWIGAVLGWRAIPFVIISSSLIGSVVGIVLALAFRKSLKTAIPFGPYLALGAVLYLFGGRVLGDWYLKLFIPGLP